MNSTFFRFAYGFVHDKILHSQRMHLLAAEVLSIMPPVSSVVDIGCGEGELIKICRQLSAGAVHYSGLEVAPRYRSAINDIEIYQGITLPYAPHTFDVCMFCDVLHHLDNNGIDLMLQEAARVSGGYILIKEHLYSSRLDIAKLKLMDIIGNATYGLPSIYNYKSEVEWRAIFARHQLEIVVFKNEVTLYGPILMQLFPARLHGLILLKIPASQSA